MMILELKAHTLLIKIENNYGDSFYLDRTRGDILYHSPIKEDLTFVHSTVDGQEWPHILGVFNIKV